MKRILLVFLLLSTATHGQLCSSNTHSLFFNGQTSYVSVSQNNDLDIEDDLTVEAWIYPVAFAQTYALGSIVCKHGWTQGEAGYVLRAGGNGQVSFNISGVKSNGQRDGWQEVVSSTGAIQLNTWTHVAGTYDGHKLRLYINGTLEETENYNGSIVPPEDYDLKIGKIADDGAANGRFWTGLIDEVRIWDRVRSQNDLSSNMDNHISGGSSGLVAYWRFNDGSGNDAEDLASNNDGVLVNASWHTNVPFSNGVNQPTINDNGGTLTSSSLYGNQWNLNGVPIPGETGITFTPTHGGEYSVTVDFGLGCIATSELVTLSFVGVNDISGEQEIRFTLIDKHLTILSAPQNIERAEVFFYSVDGRLISNKNFQRQWDLNTFPSGVYVICVKSNGNLFRSKFVLN